MRPALVALTLPLLCAAAPLQAQDYPSRPIRLVVTSAAAGTSDTLARTMAGQLEKRTGGTVVVDNRGGAGGIIATDIVAKAAPDGYTLLHATAGFVTNAALYPKLPYDIARDFYPVTDLAISTGYLLLANPSIGVGTVSELVKLARAKPDALNFASPGHGHVLHLAGELLNMRAGIKMTHVPYKGVAPALNALASGEVQIVMVPALISMPYVRSGKVRALAFTGAKRVPAAPEVPTLIESGMPGFTITGGWQAWFAPAKTPDAIVNLIHSSVQDALKTPEIHKSLVSGGYDPAGNPPAVFRRNLLAELQNYREVIKRAGIKPN
jgi:tripartite-type tricarboxylate transporter receptor subunit TctC